MVRTKNADESDETLMLRYRDGDAHAFEIVYRRHKDPLFRYLRRQVGERGIAEELCQDVWMNLIRTRERYEVRAKFSTLLYRMAHNRFVDHYRSSSRASGRSSGSEGGGSSDEFRDEAPGPDRAVDATREVARLQVLVAGLPSEQRDVFLLHVEGGLTIQTIGETTGVGKETAKSRLRYAFAKLRAGMSAD